ncbi:hypothetical protein M8J76_012939 [Diaphorina citri]|nr:hypothetical protein M8J76_012939 [Diaphorina citri]
MVRVSNILPTSYSIPNFSPPTPPKLPPSRSKTRRRPSTLTVLHHNIQSLRHKIPSIETFLNSLNEDHGLSPDILCFSETWLSPRTVNCVNIPGFVNVSSFYRQERQGGGVSVFVRDSLDFVPLSLDVDPVEFSFEFCAATSVNRDIAVICVYKSNNPESVIDVFFEGIEKLFSLLTDYRYLIVCGDFNIDTLVRSTALSTFRTILNLFNIKTCISSPTRITNTTKSCLDNILVNFQPKSLINDELNIFSGLRDHQYAQIISFHTNVTRTERVFTRKFSPHQIESFVQSLSVVDFSPVYTLSNVDDQLNPLIRLTHPTHILLIHSTHILLTHSTHILLIHSTHILLIHTTHILLIHSTNILLIHSTHICSFIQLILCSFIQLTFCSFIQLIFCLFIQLIFYSFIQLTFCSFIQLTFCSFIQLIFCSFIQLIFCSFIQITFCSFIQITFCSFIQLTFCSFIHSPHSSN